MTNPKEIKPDGWVVYHPDKEKLAGKTLSANGDWCDCVHPTFESAIRELKNDDDLQLEYSSEHPDRGFSEIVPWLREQGWRIRPVKLVFLDEVKE